jgi:hypothetical protein
MRGDNARRKETGSIRDEEEAERACDRPMTLVEAAPELSEL